jgi:hypothetical protein
MEDQIKGIHHLASGAKIAKRFRHLSDALHVMACASSKSEENSAGVIFPTYSELLKVERVPPAPRTRRPASVGGACGAVRNGRGSSVPHSYRVRNLVARAASSAPTDTPADSAPTRRPGGTPTTGARRSRTPTLGGYSGCADRPKQSAACRADAAAKWLRNSITCGLRIVPGNSRK